MENQYKRATSYSQIHTYDSCPLKFFLHYIEKERPEEIVWPGTLFGSIIHSLLDDSITAYVNGNNKILKELKTGFIDRFSEEAINLNSPKVFKMSKDFKKSPEEFYAKGQKAFEHVFTFVTKYLELNKNNVVSTEEKFISEYDGSSIQAVVDLQIINENHVDIIDFKFVSDSSDYWFKDWHNDIQSNMYDLFLKKIKGYESVNFSYLVYDKSLSMLFLKQRHEQVEDYSNILNKIKVLDEFEKTADYDAAFAIRKVDDNCKWCKYYKDHCK